jgi:uncharacterized membrane protein
MSLASMVETKLALQQAQESSSISNQNPASAATNLISQITRWIPTETITVYVALLALLAPLAGHSPSFTSRWVLFSIITASNPVVVILLTMAKTKSGDAFKCPVFEMIIASVAFAAWAFALPDTPLSSISGYAIKWNTAILTGTTIAIALLANALHRSVHIDQLASRSGAAIGWQPRGGSYDGQRENDGAARRAVSGREGKQGRRPDAAGQRSDQRPPR